jgi:RNA polymerase-binding transcription factor DksA
MQFPDINRELLRRRREILVRRESERELWGQLQEPEVEFEENAAKEKQARIYATLDEQGKQEIEQIDAALAKISTNTFGNCDRCGKPISKARLQAIPWTPLCVRCAEKLEQGADAAAEEEEIPPAGVQLGEQVNYSDSEIEDMVEDALIRDGRIDDSELHIYSKEKTIYLEGALPGKIDHELLLSLITDVLGFKDVIDHIRIDRQLWEQPGKSREKRKDEQTTAEKRMEGEGGETDVWAAMEFGTPLDPPDKLIPEE